MVLPAGGPGRRREVKGEGDQALPGELWSQRSPPQGKPTAPGKSHSTAAGSRLVVLTALCSRSFIHQGQEKLLIVANLKVVSHSFEIL